MARNRAFSKALSPFCATLISVLLLACTSQDHSAKIDTGKASVLAGTWVLKYRITNGQQSPATQRQMKLLLEPDSTFEARYRGLPEQDWVRAGRGAFSYDAPYLNFFWESGATVTFLVVDRKDDRLVLHHGRNLTPLNEQEPDEVFLRNASPKKPAAAPKAS